MTDTLIVQFQLRDGVTAASFARFVVEIDHAHNRQRPICVRFDTFMQDAGGGAPLVFEVIEVASRREWDEAMAGADQAPISETWATLVDPDSVREHWVTDVHDFFPGVGRSTSDLSS